MKFEDKIKLSFTINNGELDEQNFIAKILLIKFYR